MQEDTYRPILKGLSEGPKTAQSCPPPPRFGISAGKNSAALSIWLALGTFSSPPRQDDSRRSKRPRRSIKLS